MLIRLIVLAIFVAAATHSYAGGDDYDAANDVKGQGPAYFGFVRDARGSPVVDAQVVLQPKKGKPTALKSNVLGVYRGHISKDVLPDDVQVSCVKVGYKQTKTNRRTPPGNNAMFIETECTMQRL
ncbi:MAG TPA: hypothetical protein VGO84_18695 [Burkholderiales bacterium]|jgi:hypothetical protein|nr:hypothetical protein [Burkholderiales bacterium]